jgi:hypothetical protein
MLVAFYMTKGISIYEQGRDRKQKRSGTFAQAD